MSFQLRINTRADLEAIEISFGRQFFMPVILLAVLIVCISALMGSDGIQKLTAYTVEGSLSPSEVNRLQLQVANLEGESQRLKEFAKKMVSLAKLDKAIFSFERSPARGGLGGRNIFQRYTSGITISVGNDLKLLKKQLIEQSNQFERMQLVLKSRMLGESEKRLGWPVLTGYISSTFGIRKDPFTGRRRKHNGIDLAGPRGSSILSVAKGEVLFTGRKGGYGRVVEIKHISGFVSRYAHLEASLVKKGQFVTLGEKIALLGTSGRSTGPHLHLEILKNNKNVDPIIFLGEQR